MVKQSGKKALQTIINGIQEVKGDRIVSIDFSTIENSEFKYFVVCEGSSSTQVTAIADSVIEFAKKNNTSVYCGKDGYENAEWVILDFGDVFVHVFQPHVRQHYNIEELWADCPVTEYN